MAFGPGFDLAEALDLLTLCANIEAPNTLPVPAGWGPNPVFDSPQIGLFAEKWQLWQNTSGAYAIIVRGTVSEPGSILEDLLSVLAQATGTIVVGPFQIEYKFAADPLASVHFGFALGALLLLKDPLYGVLAKIPANSRIYIAGHSQGAAVGILLRSYLEYATGIPADNSYKTYVFAQPKPGNDRYAYDFESKFCNPGLAFRVTNSLDWVPQLPFTLEAPPDINTPNPLSAAAPSETALLGSLTRTGDQVRTAILNRVRARLGVKAAALARSVAPGAAPQLFAHGFDIIPIVRSLYFVNAATEISLIGTPCAGAQCNDDFFEHHAATYLELMRAQLGQIPACGSS